MNATSNSNEVELLNNVMFPELAPTWTPKKILEMPFVRDLLSTVTFLTRKAASIPHHGGNPESMFIPTVAPMIPMLEPTTRVGGGLNPNAAAYYAKAKLPT